MRRRAAPDRPLGRALCDGASGTAGEELGTIKRIIRALLAHPAVGRCPVVCLGAVRNERAPSRESGQAPTYGVVAGSAGAASAAPSGGAVRMPFCQIPSATSPPFL